VLALVTLFFFGVTIARSNLRKSRGDRAGAYRVGVFAFLMFLGVHLNTHIAPDRGMLGVLFTIVCEGLGLALLFWLLYIALEPLVRSRWPHSLITWNRLLAGHFGDARLGSHILAGAALGIAWLYFFYWRAYSIVSTGAPPDTTDLDGVLGGLDLAASQAQLLLNAFLGSAVLFFALCGLRALLRRDWVAMGAAALIFTLMNYNAWVSQSRWIDIPLFYLVHLCFAFTLLRMGLVPTITAIFVVDTVFKVAPSTEFAAFYTGNTVMLLAIPCCLAIYAYYVSQRQAEGQLASNSMLKTERATAV
jgi:serine/threonine-protein kinase